MSLFIALFFGAAIGLGSSFLLSKDTDLIFINVLCGIVGSILGMAVFFFLLGGSVAGAGLFNIPAMLCAIIGALVSVLVFDVLHVAVDNPSDHEIDN